MMCGWIKERILGAVSAPRRAQCRSATIIVLLYTPPRKKKLRGRVEPSQTIPCTLPKEGEYCRNGKGCLYSHLTSDAGPSSLNPESYDL